MPSIYNTMVSVKTPIIMDEINFVVDSLNYMQKSTGARVVAAYNTQRKLCRKFVGNHITVRRASDQAQADFGFNTSNIIDAAAINAWAGAAAGFIVYLKDQSNSGIGVDFQQITAGTQPYLDYAGRAEIYSGAQTLTATSLYGMSNNFAVSYVLNSTTSQTIPAEANTGYGGVSGIKYMTFPEPTLQPSANVGIGFGNNGVVSVEHADNHMPSICVWSNAFGTTNACITHIVTNKQQSFYKNYPYNSGVAHTGLASTMTNVYATFNRGGGTYGYYTGYNARQIYFEGIPNQAQLDVLQFYNV